MKRILLLSAAYLNGGAYVDAGEAPVIGPEKHEITEERALALEKSKLGEIHEVDDENDGEASGGDGLDALKVQELKDLAADEGVDLGSATTKAPIIAAIRAHRADA